jgi:hypothetical protein
MGAGRWVATGQVTLGPAQTRVELNAARTGQIALFLPDPAPNCPGAAGCRPAADRRRHALARGQPHRDLAAGSACPLHCTGRTRPALPSRRRGRGADQWRAIAVTVDEGFQFSTTRPNLQPQSTVQDFLLYTYPGEPSAPTASFVVAPSFVAEPHALRLGVIDLAVRAAATRSGALVRAAGGVAPGAGRRRS